MGQCLERFLVDRLPSTLIQHRLPCLWGWEDLHHPIHTNHILIYAVVWLRFSSTDIPKCLPISVMDTQILYPTLMVIPPLPRSRFSRICKPPSETVLDQFPPLQSSPMALARVVTCKLPPHHLPLHCRLCSRDHLSFRRCRRPIIAQVHRLALWWHLPVVPVVSKRLRIC